MPRPDPEYLHGERSDARYLERWWHHDERERYWLETTDRDPNTHPIGTTLEWEVYDSSGDRRNPCYLLALREVEDGDTVVHFDMRRDAIVACSTVAGYLTKPATGAWEIALTDKREVKPLVTFGDLQQRERDIAKIFNALPRTKRVKNPPHLPFEWRKRFGLHQGGYLTKLPRAVVELFPSLARAAR